MSNMSKLHAQIVDLLENTELTPNEIAGLLDVPLEWVYEVEEDLAAEYDDRYDDSMDGDHESALASAGWGTDEDYGSFGDEW